MNRGELHDKHTHEVDAAALGCLVQRRLGMSSNVCGDRPALGGIGQALTQGRFALHPTGPREPLPVFEWAD